MRIISLLPSFTTTNANALEVVRPLIEVGPSPSSSSSARPGSPGTVNFGRRLPHTSDDVGQPLEAGGGGEEPQEKEDLDDEFNAASDVAVPFQCG